MLVYICVLLLGEIKYKNDITLLLFFNATQTTLYFRLNQER